MRIIEEGAGSCVPWRRRDMQWWENVNNEATAPVFWWGVLSFLELLLQIRMTDMDEWIIIGHGILGAKFFPHFLSDPNSASAAFEIPKWSVRSALSALEGKSVKEGWAFEKRFGMSQWKGKEKGVWEEKQWSN
jgi:hypothetical protein